MAFNFNKLKGRIVEVYGTQYAFANAMGIAKNTLSMKLSGLSDFTLPEIKKACELLAIPDEQIKDYFFAAEVQKTEP